MGLLTLIDWHWLSSSGHDYLGLGGPAETYFLVIAFLVLGCWRNWGCNLSWRCQSCGSLGSLLIYPGGWLCCSGWKSSRRDVKRDHWYNHWSNKFFEKVTSLNRLEQVLKIRCDQNEVAHELCQIAIRRREGRVFFILFLGTLLPSSVLTLKFNL